MIMIVYNKYYVYTYDMKFYMIKSEPIVSDIKIF